ncbi:MAG TPA: DUF389 domain-containing protein [Chitinophagaceae bacterium]|nr:DUF389 domain-containing protein [Chitinophagaceae bacterium]
MNRGIASFLNHFRLKDEKENYDLVIQQIDKGTVFRGTNLWVLVFAIFIASLGLNVNSTAVIIGAMLVSPLMGPIMGLGLGMAINDLQLLRKALTNFAFATGVSLATSTLYFLLTPINDAHSELLARTSPNVYDVLIAFFGGLAGMVATSSKQKGNVLPGVAIATALMPPLCTAGYGLATFKPEFFLGAFYLFIINTVFIALATLIAARLLLFPTKHLEDKKAQARVQRITWLLVMITLIPSIYFGYDIVQRNNLMRQINVFIEEEAIFPNNYLLRKNIDLKAKKISLLYGGEFIDDKEIEKIKSEQKKYGIDKFTLDVKQGFVYLNGEKQIGEEQQENDEAIEKENQRLRLMQAQADSLQNLKQKNNQVFRELKVQYPDIISFSAQPMYVQTDSVQQDAWISIIRFSQKPTGLDTQKMEAWLRVRLHQPGLKLILE